MLVLLSAVGELSPKVLILLLSSKAAMAEVFEVLSFILGFVNGGGFVDSMGGKSYLVHMKMFFTDFPSCLFVWEAFSL